MRKKHGMQIAFVLYAALMIWLLFFQNVRIPDYSAADYWQEVCSGWNLKPFRTVGNFADVLLRKAYYIEKWGSASVYAEEARHAVINLGGNVGMFIPLGFFLPGVFAKLRKFWKTLLASGAIICTVELLQLFSLLGHCDIDDLILNLIGVAIGYGIFAILQKMKQEPV